MNTHANLSIPDMAAVLAGVRVVSIAINLPGPACARRLADFGASVIKVEPPAELGGDAMRNYARSYYDELHEGIEIRPLNLKSETDRATLDTLLEDADILLTSQRNAALERLRLDWSAISVRFPHLSQVAIVGSDAGNDAGHDLTYIAEAGLATPPILPATLIADIAGSERAATAAFAVLRLAAQSGRGQRLVVSLEAAAHAFAAPRRHGLTQTGGLLAGKHPGYNYYRTTDGWIALAALEPHFAARVESSSGVAFTYDALSAFFCRQNVDHWSRWARENDIPLAALPASSNALSTSNT